jgi:periplasmic protein TonB
MELQGQLNPYARNVSERRFWIGLACVAVFHASMIVGVGRSAPRHLGERDGDPDAISVELVDPLALRGASAEPGQAEAAHQSPPATSPNKPAEAAPPSPPPPPPAKPAPANPALEPPTPPADAAATQPAASPPPGEGKKTTHAAAKEAAPPAPALDPIAPLTLPEPSVGQPSQDKTKPTANPKLALQLDLPPNFAAPSGLSTAAVRPPDITRSGENDEFGRRVIRALRQTMPAARGELGRVTVRLLLSPTGDLMEVQLVRPAADPILTQNVVFAVKQSSFPIPPAGATRSDRTFLVTYIYN